MTSAEGAWPQLSVSADQERVFESSGRSAPTSVVRRDGNPTCLFRAGTTGSSCMGSTASAKGFPATISPSGDRGTFSSLPSTSGSYPTGFSVVGGNGNPSLAYASAQAVADGGG